MSPLGSMAALYETIVSLRQKSSSGLYFIPYSCLEQAINFQLLAASMDRLCRQQPHRKGHLTETILQNGLRVLAILVLLGQESFILDFIETLGDRIDNGLPFEQSQIDRISRKISSRFCSEVQWELIPHSFHRGSFHRRIHEQRIMPFTTERRFDEESGGEIFECTIANGQHNFAKGKEHSSSPLRIIKKKIKMVKNSKESKEQAFHKELECLEMLRCIQHTNIIELLASYEQHGDYFLIFPRLSMNLADFLALKQRYEDFKDNFTFFNALHGLSSALNELHELSVTDEESIIRRIGYHHDIKPKNVLVTNNTFVLTDFGLARLYMPEENSQSQWINTIGDYIAPECMDDDFNCKIVGRSIDVWALGCLIADVLTYMELGKEGVEKYRQKRKKTLWPQMPRNYRFFERDALRSSVIDWLNVMSTDCKVSGLPFLIELTAVTLQIDSQARPKASEVHRKLKYICAKMLYRKLVHTLQNKLEKNRKIITTELEKEISSYAQVELEFEFEKLRAWGNVLGMENEGIDHDLFLQQTAIAAVIHDSLLNHVQLHGRSSDEASGSPFVMGPTLIHERGLIKQLWEAVPIPYQILIKETWRRHFLDTEDLPRLVVVEQAARKLPSPFSQIGRDATLKRLSLKIWEENPDTGPHQRNLLISSSHIVRESKISETHEVGWLDQMGGPQTGPSRLKVFIEWVMFSPSWEKQSQEEKITKTLALAEMLSSPKPDEFRVLDCLGVTPPGEDPTYPGFGYIYKLPSHFREENSTRIRTLKEVLQEKVPLEHRFSIACRLCTSIYYLHSAGWLHENLKANNVVFLIEAAPDGSKTDTSSLDPYLVGFQHSRPDGEIWQSDYDVYCGMPSDYRHPEYTPGKTKYRKIFDYYSLGVLLLEIGFWLPISSFRAKHRAASKHDFRALLAGRYASQLDLKMGSLFSEIVATCLQGRFGDAQLDDENSIVDDFFWKVVAPLKEVKVVS